MNNVLNDFANLRNLPPLPIPSKPNRNASYADYAQSEDGKSRDGESKRANGRVSVNWVAREHLPRMEHLSEW